TCFLFAGAVVHPGDTLSTTINGAINPPTTATNPTVTVATTSDTNPATSPNTGNGANYQVVPQNPITNVTVDNDSLVSQAVGPRTIYHVGFTTSSTGGLAGISGSQFTITFPNNTDITQINSFDIRDGATQIGNSCSHTAAGANPPVLTC